MGNCSPKPNGKRASKRNSKRSNGRRGSHNGPSTAPTSSNRNKAGENGPPADSNSSHPPASLDDQRRWALLYNAYASQIVDPVDVPAVLDECVQRTLDSFQGAEITFVIRRVRKIVRSLLHSNPTPSRGRFTNPLNGNGMSVSMHNMSASHTHHSISRSHSSLNGGTIGTGASILPAASQKMEKEAKSKALYQQSHVLDEYLLRKIFVAGQTCLEVGQREQWARTSLQEYCERNGAKEDGSPSEVEILSMFQSCAHGSIFSDEMSTMDEGESYLMMRHQTSQQPLPPPRPTTSSYPPSQPMLNSLPPPPQARKRSRLEWNGKQKEKDTNHTKDDPLASNPPLVDPIGAAFALGLHFSEKRWDHVATIAHLSAQKAQLVLDKNEQFRSSKSSTATPTNHSDTHNGTNNKSHQQQLPPLPIPPPECPYHSTYYENKLPPPPELPPGLSLQELTFIIALALRQGRRQRLTFLFYLLLNPAEYNIVELLQGHPAGGIPTWLLEVDQDWILSLASLSHYYLYGGMEGDYHESSSVSQSAPSVESVTSSLYSEPPPKELKVEPLSVIETIAILLHHDADKTRGGHINHDNKNNNGTSNGTSNEMHHDSKVHTQPKSPISPRGNGQARTRALSYGDTKYHAAKMHVMLAEYLHEVRHSKGEAPILESKGEEQHRFQILDSFWDASHSQFSFLQRSEKDSDSKAGTIPTLWSLEEFLAWADAALPDDSAIDVVMFQLFGMGLLPTPSMERKLVSESWVDWQVREAHLFTTSDSDISETFSVIPEGFKNLFNNLSNHETSPKAKVASIIEDGGGALGGSSVWGGIGGFDGRGGLGYGIMYCVDKKWWDQWAQYVGWAWDNSSARVFTGIRKRPSDLSTENLLDKSSKTGIGGIKGSYETMKKDLKRGVDYELVPPGVWDVLYELYGGGPPLPRMVKFKDTLRIADNSSMELWWRKVENGIPCKIPRSLSVTTHPWVIECHVCDPHQPYRRGNVGPMSIRVMVVPEQKFWRLFAEIVLRLPIVHPRGKDSTGKGRARLWKRVDKEIVTTNGSDTGKSRFGPWELLTNQRQHASFPVGENIKMLKHDYDTYRESWEAYEEQKTVDELGLSDEMHIMFEYALFGKDGKFTWPREAAAEAGRRKKDNEEDTKFRLTLRGLDPQDNLKLNSNKVVGMVIDAMDSSGRWFQAEISDVDLVKADKNIAGSSLEEDTKTATRGEVRAVRVDFSDVGGHDEWIEIHSDRLAVAGRFTLDSMKSVDQLDTVSGGANEEQSKPPGFVLRRITSKNKQPNTFQLNSAICSFPGFGACGLANLGNTCYINSALQCISYMPMLRSYLMSLQYKRNGDLNKTNTLGTQGILLEEFAKLLKTMWSGDSGRDRPLPFRLQLGKARRRYATADQQDSQELLNDMLDLLHEDSNKVVKKPMSEPLEDDWVKKTPLQEVGTEMWRRFLRRNRSIISNIAMGQVLNRVTCPVCNHTSVNFDPFSILSMPIPTAVDVVFRCNIIRRATAMNCPQILGMNLAMKRDEQVYPLKLHLAEEYYIQMSRLANICDLKVKLHNLSGIDSGFLKLYTVDGDVTDLGSIDKENIKLKYLQTDKAEPISSAVAQHLALTPHSPVFIIVYEPTLSMRQFSDKNGNVKDQQDGGTRQQKEGMRRYGDNMECRCFDTDPLILAKRMSRSLWPTSMSQISVGLRVDAIDQKKQWYPGSVVEISKDESTMQPIAKVHFDNFQSKWDLAYSIEDFKRENIKPLYSTTIPKKPLEFEVEHCHGSGTFTSFGLPYQLQCYHEWTMARAGAHILTQAARFIETSSDEVASDKVASELAEEGRRTISKIVDILVDADRRYIETALSIESSSVKGTVETSKNSLRQRQQAMQKIAFTLKENLKGLLPRLPFEICVRDIAMNQEVVESTEGKPFLFLLDRVVGNFVNLRQKAILQWKEPTQNTLPVAVVHQKSRHILDQFILKQKALRESNQSQGGMRLGMCLDEFCKEQQLKDAGWRCPKCKEEREGKQSMELWRMPDILTLHLKRFNCSARWREKITTRVNFPLTGLNMKKWCDKDVPTNHRSDANFVYDLIGVINHYGGMTGGHYVSLCKATACTSDGSEEVEHNFNGAGVYAFGKKDEDGSSPSGWKLRNKEKDATKLQNRAAMAASKSATESSEPLWLQFDDHSVEAIPPSCVVSDSAYVLFYRKRRISPSNIARYSTMV